MAAWKRLPRTAAPIVVLPVGSVWSGGHPTDPCHTAVRTGPYTAVSIVVAVWFVMFVPCGQSGDARSFHCK